MPLLPQSQFARRAARIGSLRRGSEETIRAAHAQFRIDHGASGRSSRSDPASWPEQAKIWAELDGPPGGPADGAALFQRRH